MTDDEYSGAAILEGSPNKIKVLFASMATQCSNHIDQLLSENSSCNAENIKVSITKILSQVKRYQERIRKHIDDNYIDFMPNHSSSDLYLNEGESLLKEADNFFQNLDKDTSSALLEATADLQKCVEQLQEADLGLKVSYKILKIDNLFQCVEDANAGKDYLVVLNYLTNLKSLIYDDSLDQAFQKCDCYDTIKVKYHIQANILQQNLKQRFENLVQLSEKSFSNSKCVALTISRDEDLLQDTVMALFQSRFNPIQICEFLLKNCVEPIILKPVLMESNDDSKEYIQLTLSYSQKNCSSNLRPSYKQVFESLQLLLQCLNVINVSVSETQHVFTIIGDHIKDRLLQLLVDDCLMHAIPETMNEMEQSTIVEDVLQFEHNLADTFLINLETDRALTEFADKFETYFRTRFCRKILDTAKDIVRRDLQDMTMIAEKNTAENVADNPFIFPRCMVSKSTLELIKIMERILRQINDAEVSEENGFANVIFVTLNMYINHVPKVHEKLLESIPQQSALFYNNCMFLAHWVANNSEKGIPTFPALVKSLQATGNKFFEEQIAYQRKIIMGILREFDLSNVVTHSLGGGPLKLIRQCLRQLDLLRNVWLNVLPDKKYSATFTTLLDDFCSEIIRRIIAMEDISTTVANELSELITVILEKAPTLFQDKHEVIHIGSWMKLEQLKIILNASLQEIAEQWCGGVGILTANYKAEEVKHLIRALFQNTDRRANTLAKII